jgi:hypothetical protein
MHRTQLPAHAFFTALCLLGPGCGGRQSPSGGGPIRLSPEEQVAVKPGTTVAGLGGVAIATFHIEGQAHVEGRVEHRTHPDSMGATAAFQRPFLAAGLRIVDRQATDARLAELKHAASGLVDDDTAPGLGKELGAQTLVVGAYRFAGEMTAKAGEHGNLFIAPKRVYGQEVAVRGFDVESGEMRFDIKLKLGREADALLPEKLAAEAARRLLGRMGGGARP